MIRCKNNRTAAWLRRALALVLALLMLCGISVSAADMEDVPYYSYCYWEGPSRYEAVPMRSMYEADVQITGASLGVEDLSGPRFLTLSRDSKELYIMDGNSRITAADARFILRVSASLESAPAEDIAGAEDIVTEPSGTYDALLLLAQVIGNTRKQAQSYML